MLRRQDRSVIFRGGLQSNLVNGWVAKQFKTLQIHEAWFAADTDNSVAYLQNVKDELHWLKRNQLRCYVLIGRELIAKAYERLKDVYHMGFMPFSQLYQPESEKITYSKEWRMLNRTFSRPALTRTHMRCPLFQDAIERK